jgi:hypothetical protein
VVELRADVSFESLELVDERGCPEVLPCLGEHGQCQVRQLAHGEKSSISGQARQQREDES